MVSIDELKAMMLDMESDRIERTISFKEDKLGPATCAFSNDVANHKKPGYILIGANDDGTVNGMTITDEELQKIGNIKSNGNVLPQPSLIVSTVYRLDGGDVVVVEVQPSSYPPVRYDGRCCLILPILWTTKFTFLVEIRKVILSLFRQEKRIEALLESNLLGYPDPIE